ncbi:MAG: sn-glycerol-1-phosphate dehydrogenase, partial [Bacteroidales bacterium]|nr:sn-glycerol-1-phosphate dehydrogenase [Bacteroidales bacterium]MCF0177280.1 sn-glycerol-1-phosphate dehydrogenase [Bacteroidales bacterium]
MTSIKTALQHTTDTKELAIGPGYASKAGEVFAKLFPGAKAAIIADTNTYGVAGETVIKSLEEKGIAYEKPFVIDDPDLYAEWKFIELIENFLRPLNVVAITVGSGVMNDLVKLVSHRLGRKYMCVGTAASMDGYTAFGASITKDGNKQTMNCPAPYGFVMDTKVAAEAPKDLAASGYADLIAKVPAGADWILADAAGVEAVDAFAWSFVQDGLRHQLADPAGVFAGKIEPTEALSEGLILSGFAMQAFQSSRPASGAEHQFSHCWDMENLCYENGKHVSHGFKVGIGTLTSTAAIEFLLKTDIRKIDVEKCVAAWPTWEEMEERIKTLFA